MNAPTRADLRVHAHGTNGGYNAGCHCQDCRTAATEHRRARKLAIQGPPQHHVYRRRGDPILPAAATVLLTLEWCEHDDPEATRYDLRVDIDAAPQAYCPKCSAKAKMRDGKVVTGGVHEWDCDLAAALPGKVLVAPKPEYDADDESVSA